MSALSGQQYDIAHGELRATVSGLGAALRGFTCKSVPIVWESPADVLPKGSSGQVLAPWPNRLADGEYAFDGVRATAALDEPSRHNAIHGLVRWLYWELEYLERDRIKLHCSLAPQPGYPFQISISILYALSDRGLEVRTEAEAAGGGAAPFGVGFHPYFLAASTGLKGSRLVIPSSRHYLLDDRGLPVGVEPLAGELAELDSDMGLALDDVRLDDCFAGLRRDGSGNAVVRFFPGEGEVAEVVLCLDENFDYVMCYTGDTLAAEDQRRAVAIEPMTCAPNALVSGDGLLRVSETTPFRSVFSIVPKMTDS